MTHPFSNFIIQNVFAPPGRGSNTLNFEKVNTKLVTTSDPSIPQDYRILNAPALNKATSFYRNTLDKAFEDATQGSKELLVRSYDNEGKVKGFRKGVVPPVGYFISHESHHREKYAADSKAKRGKNS